MARIRMEWDYVKGYPIVVFMQFIDHGKWHVKICKGPKGNVNSAHITPKSRHWKKYITTGPISRRDVLIEACKRSRKWIEVEEANERQRQREINNDN